MWGSQGWNQWAMQPAMFNDVPHEQIDWAELAKQWIQMQQNQPSEVSSAPPPLPTQAPPLPPPPPGLVPQIPEPFSVEVATTPLLKDPLPPGVQSEPFIQERTFQESTKDAFAPKDGNSKYWSKSNWEPVPTEADERMWPRPPVDNVTPLIGGKETFDYGHMHDNPPLAMQSIDYNHMSEYSYNQIYPAPPPPPPPHEIHYDHYWSQVNAAPPISPMFLKKHRNTNSIRVEEEPTSHIDAAKRKHLPAWIREGLEKMEQERLKRLDKEKESRDKVATEKLRKDLGLAGSAEAEITALAKSKFDSGSEDEDEEVKVDSKVPSQRLFAPKIRPPSPEEFRTEEEKKQDLMLKVRRMLTEVLLSVTNTEMRAIAQEVYKKAKAKAPARQLASTASLNTVASSLRGLASYGTESEASDAEDESDNSESEEELYRRIREKKKLFAVKERKIVADLERREREERMEHEKRNDERNARKIIKDPLPEKLNASNDSNENEKRLPATEHEEASASEAQTEVSENHKNADVPVEKQSKEHSVEKSKKASRKNQSDTSGSTSSSSESESDEKHRKKYHKESKKSKTHAKKSKRNSDRKEDRRHSRDSDISDMSKERSREKNRSIKMKNKSKRSDSSSSSDSSSNKKKHGTHDSNHRERRSHEERDRKRRRSRSSSRSRRKSDSRSHRSSHSHRSEDKYSKRHKEEKRHHDSPSRHSSKLPKKYRTSRSSSSDSDCSGKRSKKSRKH